MNFLKRNKIKLFAVLCFVFLTASIYDIEATRIRIGTAYLKDTLTGGLVSGRFYANDSITAYRFNSIVGGLSIPSGQNIIWRTNGVKINSTTQTLKFYAQDFETETVTGTVLNTVDSLYGTAQFSRFQQSKGDSVASATTVTLGHLGNVYVITGTTTIQNITTTQWNDGATIILYFRGSVTIDEGTGNIRNVAGDISATAGQAYQFTLINSLWVRVL
jgi:hypothetical protein